MSSMKAGVPGGMVVGPRDASIANPLAGSEPDRKLRGLPDGGGKTFDRSSTERPFTANPPTNPKGGTVVDKRGTK